MSDSNNSAGESQQGTIYKILCLVTGKPYVGQTRQKLNRRISEHKSSKIKRGIDAEIAKYGWEGNFTVEVLEVCPVEKLNEREIFWIAKLNSKIPNGYNLTEGGDGSLNPSEETRNRISANHADVSGKNNPNYGKKHSSEALAKMSAAKSGENNPLFGKHQSSETCAKISEHHKLAGVKPPSQKGKKRSPETCARISNSKKGKKGRPHTLEEIAKISAANKGKPSPQKGKSRPPEVCAKISAGQKARWAKKKLENGGNK